MQAGNLTNVFAALLIILKSTFTLVVPMKHCSDEFRFAHQQNLYRTISLLLISLKGESYMYLVCFPESEQEVDNTKSIVLCE